MRIKTFMLVRFLFALSFGALIVMHCAVVPRHTQLRLPLRKLAKQSYARYTRSLQAALPRSDRAVYGT